MASQILASFMIQVKAVRLYSVQVAVWLGYQYSFFETPQTRMIAIRWRSPFRYSVPTMLQGKQSKREYVYTGTCACTINQPVECSQVRKQCTIILQWINMQSVCCSLHCLTAVLCRHHIQVIQRGTGVGDTVSLMCVSKSEVHEVCYLVLRKSLKVLTKS